MPEMPQRLRSDERLPCEGSERGSPGVIFAAPRNEPSIERDPFVRLSLQNDNSATEHRVMILFDWCGFAFAFNEPAGAFLGQPSYVTVR